MSEKSCEIVMINIITIVKKGRTALILIRVISKTYLARKLNFQLADLESRDNYFFVGQVLFVVVGILGKDLELEDYEILRKSVLRDCNDLKKLTKVNLES